MEQQPHESTLLKLALKTATSLSTLQIKVNDENCNLPIHSSSSVVCRVLKPILSSSQQNSRLIQFYPLQLYLRKIQIKVKHKFIRFRIFEQGKRKSIKYEFLAKKRKFWGV